MKPAETIFRKWTVWFRDTAWGPAECEPPDYRKTRLAGIWLPPW